MEIRGRGRSQAPCFLLGLLAVLYSDSALSIPVLYPVSSGQVSLLEDLSSNEVISIAGAFSNFLCSDDNSIADFPLRDCADLADKLIVRTPRSSIRLAFNDVDPAGNLRDLSFGTLPQVNVTEEFASVENISPTSSILEFSINMIVSGVPIKVSIDYLGQARSVIVMLDNDSPSVSVKSRDSTLREDSPYAEFTATFSKPVVPNVQCNADVPQFISPETVFTLLEASSKCAEDLASASFDKAYTVDMVDRSESSYNAQERVLTIRAYPDPTPVVASPRVLISFKINSNAIIDYAGNSATYLGSLTVGYIPPEPQSALPTAPPVPAPVPVPTPPPASVPAPALAKPMNDTKTAEDVGKATSAMVVATTVSSLGGSLIAAAASSATLASGAAGGATSAGAAASGSASLGGILSILNMGQKIYLTSKMAVAIVPENYLAFASQMQWTMFDIRAPWENKETTQEEDAADEINQSSRKLHQNLPNIYQGKDQYVVLKRVLFWVGIVHMVSLVLHALCLGALTFTQRKVPHILYFPRLEIYTAYWTMPAVATACAGMFQGDADSKLIGAIVLVALPGSFLVAHIVVLYLYFLRKNPVEWEARVILNLSAMSSQSMCQDDFKTLTSPSALKDLESLHVPSQSLHPPNHSTENDTSIAMEMAHLNEAMSNRQRARGMERNILQSVGRTVLKWIDMVVFWLWLGPPMVNGEWKTKSSDTEFLARFGPMFEECRGAGVIMTRAPTFALDPVTKKIDRGSFRAVMEHVPGFTYCSFVRLHHLQVMTTAANYVKLIIFAVVIGAEENDESFSQLVFLLLVATSFTLFLRVSRPYMVRIELALALLAESADIVTFILGISLIVGPVSNPTFRKSVGLGMLWTEGVAFGVMVVEKLLEVLIKVYEKLSKVIEDKQFEKSKGAELASALRSVLLTHPGYLERKFGHRWMVRSLGRGLTGRVLVGDEVRIAKVAEKKVQKTKH